MLSRTVLWGDERCQGGSLQKQCGPHTATCDVLCAGKSDAVPLLVVLHTWHGDYKQTYQSACADWCLKNDWAYLHPNFRGPNTRPEATGSELVIQDIADGVDYAKHAAKIDGSRIYLLGTSGGGYTALLMAGRRPALWAGVSAWVPISDLAAWYGEIKKSGRENCEDVSRSCGGPPGASKEVDREYHARSPLSYLEHAQGLPLDINAGIRDGHDGSVPISHSLRAFNAVAATEDRISAGGHTIILSMKPPYRRNCGGQFPIRRMAISAHSSVALREPSV